MPLGAERQRRPDAQIETLRRFKEVASG